jgi:ABC-type cobalamin/Fe3+-siderophores transport systems, ATPase components
MLEVRNLSFSYGEKKVLNDISFKAEGNNILSILGPNGVGKTTLLKCICDFHGSNSDTVFIDGNDVTGMSRVELARHIGYVPQRAIASQSTVFDTVLIGRRPYMVWGATKEDVRMTYDVMLSLGLKSLMLSYADEISGGEFQKVQIARVLVQDPKVIVMDEPTNNLDLSNQHISMKMIANAVRSKGVCTIMSMHDINLAIQYSDELMFMKEGNILGHGSPDIVTEKLVKDVYGIDVDIIEHKGLPYVIPNVEQNLKTDEKDEAQAKQVELLYYGTG